MRRMAAEAPAGIRTDAPGEIDVEGSLWWALTAVVAHELAAVWAVLA